MLPPRGRKGAAADQKGPRMVDEVGSLVLLPLSWWCLWAISSTRLVVQNYD
jgi:hypothetical protein